jgi:putative FmdB family regulatory protein
VPIYEYECESCHRRTEVMQKVNDPPLDQCEHCGGKLRKLLSAPGIQFKGSGWYVTDYSSKLKSKEEKKPEPEKKKDPAAAATKSESAPKKDSTSKSESTQKRDSTSKS